ncbi:MAG: hypothetical protein K2M46_02120 [Lachnospiraceae bacterium]|nr:hypothetical protein [Lachnospiraceae bacterium]
MSRAQERIAKAREKIQVIAHDFCQIYKDEKGSSYLTAFYIVKNYNHRKEKRIMQKFLLMV